MEHTPMWNDIEQVIVRRIERSPQYAVGQYDYFVWPYKGMEGICPDELEFLAKRMAGFVAPEADALFTFMTDGEIIGVALSLITRLPLIICRDYHYNLPEVLTIEQKTAYFSRHLYCARPAAKTNICVIDAIASTGATICAAGRAIREAGCHISSAIAAVEKVDFGGAATVQRELGLALQVLYRVTRDDKGIIHVTRAS